MLFHIFIMLYLPLKRYVSKDFLFITFFPVTFFGQNNRQDIWIYKNKRQTVTSTS